MNRPRDQSAGRRGIIELERQKPFGFREWDGLERGLDDNTERAERTDVELAKIVTCDVLDDFAPGARHLTVSRNDAQADREVTGGAERHSRRAGQRTREDAAYGRAF